MKIGIGSDHNAIHLRNTIKNFVEELGHDVVIYNSEDNCNEIDYPGVAFEVAEAVSNKQIERGILLCGTGLGMALAANKVPGIRAVTVHDVYSAERAQLSNNAQIITLGEKVIGTELAKYVVKTYLSNTFQGGQSERKIQQIMDKENQYLKQ